MTRDKNCDKERKELLDLLTDIFKVTAPKTIDDKDEFIDILDYNEDYDEDYIDIMHLNITSFKQCFVEEYNNVVDIEKYRAYKFNTGGINIW